MNTLNHYVTEVKEGPTKEEITPDEINEELFDWEEIEEENGQKKIVFWKVVVEAEAYGRTSTQTLTFDSEEEAQKVDTNYVFKA